MTPRKHKIYRYLNTRYGSMLDKESEIIEHIRLGELDQCLLLYQCREPTIVLPSGNKWRASDELKASLHTMGWQIFSRRSGGAPVPQTSGLINLSHFYLWPEDSPYSVKQAYEDLCQVLHLFFHSLDIKAEAHATPGSFCDGDYNLNIKGKKIVGTAQRVLTARKGRKLVLAQACILVDEDMSRLVQPVNHVNSVHGIKDKIEPSVHTCIAQHVDKVPETDALYSALVQAFITSELYSSGTNHSKK